MSKVRVTIWHEFFHEHINEEVAALYPDGMHECLAKSLQADDLEIRTAWLMQDDDHGLSDDVLNSTDVMLWWGHALHEQVRDDIAEKVVQRVLDGMGFIALHSAHMAKPFCKLMGQPCKLRWRCANEKAIVWNVHPTHPITQGVPLHFELEREEMYGEVFQIPQPDDLLFITWFAGGNVFRGGCTFTRALGKIFYFHPGHEDCPSFHNENVIKIIANSIRWAAPGTLVDLQGNEFEPMMVGGEANE